MITASQVAAAALRDLAAVIEAAAEVATPTELANLAGLDMAPSAQICRELVELAEIIESRPQTHVIDFDPHGWTIMHPLVGCGMDLFDCPVNEAAERGLTRPSRYARYRCHVDDSGALVIGEKITSPADEVAGP